MQIYTHIYSTCYINFNYQFDQKDYNRLLKHIPEGVPKILFSEKIQDWEKVHPKCGWPHPTD